ncbi:hypothetical protein GA0070612_6085 [Micromonospora chokoriensis]|uniref:Uncharacterized protein n=1 Tax=Micromonospora chokoriensis TaxID=356851 RepID=A0A1C4ZAM1_9ACTN|nr:hypothetical protein GA0070612_6085 [Micromonospora chokoriensis]
MAETSACRRRHLVSTDFPGSEQGNGCLPPPPRRAHGTSMTRSGDAAQSWLASSPSRSPRREEQPRHAARILDPRFARRHRPPDRATPPKPRPRRRARTPAAATPPKPRPPRAQRRPLPGPECAPEPPRCRNAARTWPPEGTAPPEPRPLPAQRRPNLPHGHDRLGFGEVAVSIPRGYPDFGEVVWIMRESECSACRSGVVWCLGQVGPCVLSGVGGIGVWSGARVGRNAGRVGVVTHPDDGRTAACRRDGQPPGNDPWSRVVIPGPRAPPGTPLHRRMGRPRNDPGPRVVTSGPRPDRRPVSPADGPTPE